MPKKTRLDDLIVTLGLADDVDSARRLIMAGEVRSGDHVWEKAGEKIPSDTSIQIKPKGCKWASMGGLKLEEAVRKFMLNFDSLDCLDIGASTGGFTDVLLHFGARKVVAVDVGYGLLCSRLQNDPRVVVKDRTNFREATCSDLEGPFDIIVTDVSFISLKKILPNAKTMMKSQSSIIALIKPQFEADRHLVPEGGVVKSYATHFEVITSLQQELRKAAGLFLHSLAPAPLIKIRKNIEFLSLWKTFPAAQAIEVESVIANAHARSAAE